MQVMLRLLKFKKKTIGHRRANSHH